MIGEPISLEPGSPDDHEAHPARRLEQPRPFDPQRLGHDAFAELDSMDVRPTIPVSRPPFATTSVRPRSRPPSQPPSPSTPLATTLAASAWLSLAGAAAWVAAAQPPAQLGFFTHMTGAVPRSFWISDYLAYAVVCAGFAWLLAVTGLVVQARTRPKDRIPPLLYTTFGIALVTAPALTWFWAH